MAGTLPPPPIEDTRARRRPTPWRTPEPMDRKGPKVRWTAGEMNAVAAAEDRLRATNCKNVNKELHLKFPDRTLEAIKGMGRLPKYRALLGRSRVRGIVAPVESPPSMVAERGASPQLETDTSSPPSPGSPAMIVNQDIRTPEAPTATVEDRGEDEYVREVLYIPAEASPSCNPQSEDASRPSGEDGGNTPNPFDSFEESYNLYRHNLCESLLLAQDCFVGLDATEFIGFKPDQLSRMDKNNIDKEYTRWIQHELTTGESRKGPTSGGCDQEQRSPWPDGSHGAKKAKESPVREGPKSIPLEQNGMCPQSLER